MIDWTAIRRMLKGGGPQPLPARVRDDSPIIARAQLRPIVFREICSPIRSTGLSFYGGSPIGPASFDWPRNKEGVEPLSFVMQWDCAELAGQDATGLLPKDGVLYLFADLKWNDFRFIQRSGSAAGWLAVALPSDLPPLYGMGGAYHFPFCCHLIALEIQDVPRLLPKWPFKPIAFDFPPSPADSADEPIFWNEGDALSDALLRLQHPEGIPSAQHLDKPRSSLSRPFAAFPHDYAAIRVVAGRVLEDLRRPANRFLRDQSEPERETTFRRWRVEAAQRYRAATAHLPSVRVEQAIADETWHWIEGLEPVLLTRWNSLVGECVNASLGIGSEAADTLPPELVANCEKSHRLASAYLHEEYRPNGKPEALAAWEQRRAERTLADVRTIHAPCPNHMFGPPSYVQGHVEEHLEHSVLLLELSTHQPIGHEFGEGVLQFMIRPADLKEGRFDKTILVASAY